MKEIEYDRSGRTMSEYGYGSRNRRNNRSEERNWEHTENNFDEIVNKSLQRIPYVRENRPGVRRLDDPIRTVDDPEFNNMHGNPIREAKVDNSEMLNSRIHDTEMYDSKIHDSEMYDSRIHDSEFLKTDRQSYTKYSKTGNNIQLDFLIDGNAYVITTKGFYVTFSGSDGEVYEVDIDNTNKRTFTRFTFNTEEDFELISDITVLVDDIEVTNYSLTPNEIVFEFDTALAPDSIIKIMGNKVNSDYSVDINVINLPSEHTELTLYLTVNVSPTTTEPVPTYYKTFVNFNINSTLVSNRIYNTTTTDVIKINHHSGHSDVTALSDVNNLRNEVSTLRADVEYLKIEVEKLKTPPPATPPAT